MDILAYDKEIFSGFVYEGIEKEYTGPDVRAMVDYYSTFGDCWMGMIDGKIVGAGGVYPLWDGAGSAWLFINPSAAIHKVSLFKGMLEKLNEGIKKYGIRLMFVNCVDNLLQANTLITHLGFTKSHETKMAMYVKGVA